ncbi:alpha-ketoglutarate-dependent dioxygenase alkB homolog 6-like isoform X1 [Zingiber officinale]|uniref:alpha-ketoglutarate-dependent dioxygenase alkB homolog 6-like isoform X1 n=1 Tax=Zingiber officinale TaxID=94328 RepID=UPI001C4C7104|nr:alpha-ketoglutarate-dependent dioxygenase alkB homolog 6-like isoform X1 [Zingiber officinale]
MEEEDGKYEKGLDIGVHIVGSLPTIIYIPDFIYQSEQSQLLHDIYEAPASRWKSLKNRRLQNWGGVVHEKGLLPQPSIPGCVARVHCLHLVPSWLTKTTQRICQKTGLFPSAINHVLINEYLPDQGIMPHQDGPAYFPVVAILSLESPITIEFTPHPRSKDKDLSVSETAIGQQDSPSINSDEHDSFSILLMPRSLLIFKDHAYTDYLHGIQDSVSLNLDKVVNTAQVMELKETELLHGDVNMSQSIMFRRTSKRVSLTCRLVLKVHKNLFKF